MTEHTTLTPKDLLALGLPQGPEITLALTALRAGATADDLRAAIASPEAWREHPLLGELAVKLNGPLEHARAVAAKALRPEPLPYARFGADMIEPGATAQMDVAMRLPVAVAGALMPDAHAGYGLPIGGVFAAHEAIIPYFVGVDIGCSMRLSLLPVPFAGVVTGELAALLRAHTRFGAGQQFAPDEREDHPVLHESTWNEQPLLRSLRDKAAAQIGSSGSGNHFVEFGVVTLDAPEHGLEPGTYLSVLSHSGSRGFGATAADAFVQEAAALHTSRNSRGREPVSQLAPEAQKGAWLPLSSDAGQRYLQAMQLAGRYALANHELIHGRLARALGVVPAFTVSNSHNLAWVQGTPDGTVVVHRKGATPAAAGEYGVIPGSMADPTFVVRGLGNAASLESSSHGAGRQLGRRAAQRELSARPEETRAYLESRGVTVLGGGLDEHPLAYKRIEDVMAAQRELVEPVLRFDPRVVMMADDSHDNGPVSPADGE